MNENRTSINIENDPIELFRKWFEEASKNELNDANAMNLSTISNEFKPSSRMVLLKDFNKSGFVFYTNVNSKKGISILNNPNVALNFHWKSLLRQIRIEGIANQVSDEEADKYFDTRPKDSRIGAWASDQSSELLDRNKLLNNINYYKNKFKDIEIPRPDYWRGFKVNPLLIEFWQDMPFRLHERLEFLKVKEEWVSRKLYP